MQLATYQEQKVQELYDSIVDKDKHTITFTGPKGCGKSKVVNQLAYSLQENWKVFIITGTGIASPPYYTWYAATRESTNIKKSINHTDISFGINLQPFGLPIGVQMGVEISGSNLLFNSNEQSIIKAIVHTVAEKDNILLLAEDYNVWDSASKELILKMILSKTHLFGNSKSMHIVLIDNEINQKELCNAGVKIDADIHINEIPINDLEQIINQLHYENTLQKHDIKEILCFTGYDLRLIQLAVHYQQENIKTPKSIYELLENRLTCLPESQQNLCQTLERVSIINSLFSEKEAAYLMEYEPVNAERILAQAVSLKLIRKRHAYDFANPKIKCYFEEKLDVEKKYLHYRFAEYLKKYYPEDYFSRAYHLYLSEGVNNKNNLIEATCLLAIEIIRRKELMGDVPDKHLYERLAEMLDDFPQPIEHYAKLNIDAFYKGYDLMNQCRYREAIIYFSSIHFVYASDAFCVEAKRLLLFCHVQLADDLHKIKLLADELNININKSAFEEDEIWCRVVLLLLEVYGDRHVQEEIFQKLKNGFEARIRKHMYQSSFHVLHAKYACKSILFYTPVIATKLTEESCDFYRLNNSVSNLYYSLCNNAGNLLVCGEYKAAEQKLCECLDIMSENPDVILASTYKVENNIIINKFLQSEGLPFVFQTRSKDKILSAASKAVKSLQAVSGYQGYEVSHVIKFNILSMLMLLNRKEKTNLVLEQINNEYYNLDEFYKYYYHNAACMKNILEQNFDDALTHLEKLKALNVILFNGIGITLNHRNQIIHQLINEKFSGNSYELNYEFVRRGFHVQEPSASFWGRAYLLSDLQYLSL